jgi:hypothetical protein
MKTTLFGFLVWTYAAAGAVAAQDAECDCSKIIGQCSASGRLVSQKFVSADPLTGDARRLEWILELIPDPAGPRCSLIRGAVFGIGGANADPRLSGNATNIYERLVKNGPVQIVDYQNTTASDVRVRWEGNYSSCRVCAPVAAKTEDSGSASPSESATNSINTLRGPSLAGPGLLAPLGTGYLSPGARDSSETPVPPSAPPAASTTADVMRALAQLSAGIAAVKQGAPSASNPLSTANGPSECELAQSALLAALKSCPAPGSSICANGRIAVECGRRMEAAAGRCQEAAAQGRAMREQGQQIVAGACAQ